MSLKNFHVNTPANPYHVTVNTVQNMQFTMEFMNAVHPNSVILQYDIDASGKAKAVLFSNGSTSCQQTVNTPQVLNNAVPGSFTLGAGKNGALFGINISVVNDPYQPQNINVSLSNPSGAMNSEFMKAVDLKIQRAVKTAIKKHEKDMHAPKTKKKA